MNKFYLDNRTAIITGGAQGFGLAMTQRFLESGANVIILPGVTLGRNSVVGAGSIVTKSVADHNIVAGNPAKVIKDTAT